MKRFKQLLSIGLALSLAIPVYAEANEITSNANQDVKVTADVSSSWIVTLPKAINLTSQSQGSGTYTGSIPVTVQGDIGVKEIITVDTNNSLQLSDSTGANTESLTATVSKDKIEFKFNDLTGNQTAAANHELSANLVPGDWSGTLPFYINIKNQSITVTSKDSQGNDLNATATEITGTEKETLLTSLESTGMISSADEVDALIEVESDDFEGMADTTFNVSSIASEGEKVAILHFNETKQEWEYISTETVNADGLISADFSSYSPVAFVKVNSTGNYENMEAAGLYDANGVLLCAWEESGIDVSTNYDRNVTAYTTTPYYVIKNKYPTTTKIVIPEGTPNIGNYVFYQCTELTEIIIPDGITYISYGAFDFCTNLHSIVLPSSITYIDDWSFSSISSLTIKFKGTERQWGNIGKALNWGSYSGLGVIYNYVE